jgi:hypothetical protein
MHKARAFFFICAGLFLLALAYHLGARSAGAQSQVIQWADCSGKYMASVDRVVWEWDAAGLHRIAPPIPGTSSVIAMSSSDSGAAIILASGDCYWWSTGAASWQLVANLLGGAVSAAQPTWGQVKAKYATPAPAKQP